MNVSQVDKSYYLKGLLILAGRDRCVDPRERELMLKFAKILDFDKRFCEATIDDLFRNKYLTREPIVFSGIGITRCFIRDGIRLAYVDADIHPKEMAWLKTIAKANGLTEKWLSSEIKRFLQKKFQPDLPPSLEIQRYLNK